MIGTAPRPSAAPAREPVLPRWRVYAVAAVLAAVAGALIGRLVDLQVLQGDRFREMATEEHWRRTVVPPRRGEILDANGAPLAASVTYQSLYASTNEITDPAAAAAALAPILGQPRDALAALLARKQSAPVLVQRWLSNEAASAVEKLGQPGLFLQFEPRRVYPQGTLAAQVLGVVGVDNNGLSGLELQYNADLAGKPGALVAERDSAGDAIALGARRYTPPVDGATLQLTLDRYVEWVAERALEDAFDRQHARRGTVVILDPRTGGILAMAARPSFQPDGPDLYSPATIALYPIPAVARADEPGTALSFVTMAAALDTGLVGPATSIENGGAFSYYGETFRDDGPPPGRETMARVLTSGSRVGLAWLGTRLGAAAFYRYAAAFGLGQPTGVDLPGEVAGAFRTVADADWFPTDLAHAALGTGVTVTPLQLAAAMGAVAHGGALMRPYLVRAVAGPAGSRVYYPTVVGHPVRPETAAALTAMLVAAVSSPTEGSARFARVPGYPVAGLAGQTRAATPDGDLSIGTFVGFAPADDPRFVGVVQIAAPAGGEPTDALAAATFAAIARPLLAYARIPPAAAPGGT